MNNCISIIEFLHDEIVDRHKRVEDINSETAKIFTRIRRNGEFNNKLIEEIKAVAKQSLEAR